MGSTSFCIHSTFKNLEKITHSKIRENNFLCSVPKVDATKSDSQIAKPESMEDFQQLANLLLAKFLQTQQIQKEKDLKNSENFWVESEALWICNPCLFFSKSPDCPAKLITLRRGNFGYVNNTGKPYYITSSKKNHTDNPLHKWCVKQHKKETKLKNSADRKNEYAAKRIIRNALICLKRSWSGEDFLALNEKNMLDDMDIGAYVSATKNDSRGEFFRLRSLIFDIVSEKTKIYFENIENIAVTLDKVTVHR